MVNGQWSVVNSSLANKNFISNYYICTGSGFRTYTSDPTFAPKRELSV